MKPSEVIREARNVLFERGWYQGHFTPWDEEADEPAVEGGPLCAYGAVRVAAGVGFYCDLDADDFLEEMLPTGFLYLDEWNDDPDRKFDEVVDLFDRAEKLALIAEDSDE